jgi:hypothetical protein
VLCLSATAGTAPFHFRALGYALDLHNLNADCLRPARPAFDRWVRSHGCVFDPGVFSWRWNVGVAEQKIHMASIRDAIIPARGVRVSWRDIPNFPDRTISAELVDLDAPEKIDGCYQQMAAAVEALNLRATNDRDPEMAVTALLRAREQVELLKVPAFAEMADDYRAKGFSVVFFVNFRSTIEELFKRFPDFRIIDGITKNRDTYVDQFQINSLPGLIVNNSAGGICLSFHDLDGFHPRVGLVSAGFSATDLRQIFGRLHREGGKTPCFYRVLFAAKTVEVKVHRQVSPKLDNLDALNDADLQPSNLKIV